MKIQVVRNIKNFFNKYIFQNCKNKGSDSVHFLKGIDLNKIAIKSSPERDAFLLQKSPKKLLTILDEKFNIKAGYDSLSPTDLQMIRAELKYFEPEPVEYAEILVRISKIINRVFDEKFGENQYIFVSIGRSLSALATCLQLSGVEAKHIPLSGCSASVPKTEIVKRMVEQNGFSKYKDLLEKTLDRNTNKKYVFCDYAVTGKTLKIFETFLKHPKVNLSSDTDSYIGINYNFFTSDLGIKLKAFPDIKKFMIMLNRQCFDKYSDVRYLSFENLNALGCLDFLSCYPIDLKQKKLLKFCILDILKTSKVMG